LKGCIFAKILEMSKQGDSGKGKSFEGKKKQLRKKSSVKGKTPNAKVVSAPKKASNPDEMRLNKYIANSGMCSRREADMHISIGSVMVNGEIITEMGYKVKLTDEVKFDGVKIKAEKPVYVLLNKPKGFFVSSNDEGNTKTVMDLVKTASKFKILPIGKMEKQGMGLLLFTNDGALSKKLNSNGGKIRTIYQATLDKPLKFEDIDKIKNGVIVDRKKILVDAISHIEDKPKTEVGIQLKSGKSGLVQQIFAHLKYEIQFLDRVSYAGLTKKDLPRGTYRHLTEQEVINLRMMKVD
jgi:23S rRNA pseudouridine2605 synthase